MKTLFAITKVAGNLRVLADANQGRYHFATREEAEGRLKAILSNNHGDTLRSVFGDTSKMRVDAVECYDHGDAVGTVLGFAD
jgi:hypothetical protein